MLLICVSVSVVFTCLFLGLPLREESFYKKRPAAQSEASLEAGRRAAAPAFFAAFASWNDFNLVVHQEQSVNTQNGSAGHTAELTTVPTSAVLFTTHS